MHVTCMMIRLNRTSNTLNKVFMYYYDTSTLFILSLVPKKYISRKKIKKLNLLSPFLLLTLDKY